MNLPLHPALVHLPLGLALSLPLAALAVAAALWRGWFPARTWFLVVGLQALLVGSGVVPLRSGGTVEGRVENRVGRAALERHEEAVEVFVAAAGLDLLVAGAGLLLEKRPVLTGWAARGRLRWPGTTATGPCNRRAC